MVNWFSPKSWENAELYEHLGVRTFKEWMVPSGDKIRRGMARLLGQNPSVSRNRADLESMLQRTKLLETAHISLALGVVGFTALFVVQGDYLGAIGSTGINILGNAYPILVQRYNRLRLYKVLGKAEKNR